MSRIDEIEARRAALNRLPYPTDEEIEAFENNSDADIDYLLMRVKAADTLYEGVRMWIKNERGVRNLAVVMYEYEAALEAQDGE